MLNDTADLHDDDAVEMFFDMADTDHDGQISFDDFLRVIRDEEWFFVKEKCWENFFPHFSHLFALPKFLNFIFYILYIWELKYLHINTIL